MKQGKRIPVGRAILCVILCVIFTALTTYQFTYYGLSEAYRAARAEEDAALRAVTRQAEENARRLQAEAAALRSQLAVYLGEAGDSDANCLRWLLRRALLRRYGASITLREEEIEARMDAYMATYASDATAVAEKLLFIDFLYREHYRGAYTAGAVENTLIEAYIAATGDVYSRYYSAEAYEAFRRAQETRAAGIGVITAATADGSAIEVLYVHTASPAQGKLQPGDLLVGVGDLHTPDASLDEIRAAVSGGGGTDVTLSVLRGGSEIAVTVTRGEIETDAVIGDRLEHNGKTRGYVRILSFSEQTPEQFRRAMEALAAGGIDTYILDVRDNGGGLVSALSATLDMLLPAGAPICTFEYANGDSKAPITARGDSCFAGTFYVLQNRATASCAELFCAALRDNGRATLVGETTYGKGTVQGQFLQEDGSCVTISVARYMPPGGENYEGVGVSPDVPVSQPAGRETVLLWRLPRAEDAVLDTALACAAAE